MIGMTWLGSACMLDGDCVVVVLDSFSFAHVAWLLLKCLISSSSRCSVEQPCIWDVDDVAVVRVMCACQPG